MKLWDQFSPWGYIKRAVELQIDFPGVGKNSSNLLYCTENKSQAKEIPGRLKVSTGNS